MSEQVVIDPQFTIWAFEQYMDPRTRGEMIDACEREYPELLDSLRELETLAADGLDEIIEVLRGLLPEHPLGSTEWRKAERVLGEARATFGYAFVRLVSFDFGDGFWPPELRKGKAGRPSLRSDPEARDEARRIRDLMESGLKLPEIEKKLMLSRKQIRARLKLP